MKLLTIFVNVARLRLPNVQTALLMKVLWLRFTSADGTLGIMVEVNCETDFVARNEEFVAFAAQIGETLLTQNVTTVEELMAQSAGDKTLNDLYNEILAKFSEKIGVKRFERRITSTGTVASYIHAVAKIRVLIETTAPVRSESDCFIARHSNASAKLL